MQLLDRGFGDGKVCATFVDKSKRIAIAAHLFLVAVLEWRLAKNQRPNARLVDFYPLDSIRGHRTFDEGVFAQDLEPLR